MRTILGRFGATSVAAALLLAAAARADDKKPEKMTLDKAPKAVQDAFNARFPGGEVTSLTKETDAGKVIYDIELKHKGRKYEMDVQEDGTVLEVEKEKDLKEVPAALAKTVDAKFPKAKIQVIMEVNLVKGKVETPDHYEVTVTTADNKTEEILITLDGKNVHVEKK
jgi:Peptidase propeptide and YPEB domain